MPSIERRFVPGPGRSWPLVLVLSLGLLGPPALPGMGVGSAVPRQTADEPLLREFQARVAEYVALHKRIEGSIPTTQQAGTPAEFVRLARELGTKIRAARADARQGDIFSPEVAQLFRERIALCLQGRDLGQLKRLFEEGAPPIDLKPRVNDSFPTDFSLPMMPPRLACALPTLEEDLEFRVMGRDLILWDTHANLIVDFVPDALPEFPNEQ